MARQAATHWNTPDRNPWTRYIGKVRCGRDLMDVKWSPNPAHATCMSCVKGAAKDREGSVE